MHGVGGRDGRHHQQKGKGGGGGLLPPSALLPVIQAGDTQALKRAIAGDDRWARQPVACLTTLCLSDPHPLHQQRRQRPAGPLGAHAPDGGQCGGPGALRGPAPLAGGAGRQGKREEGASGAYVRACVCVRLDRRVYQSTIIPTQRRRQLDADGSTALHLAAAGGHDPVVHILLYHDADVFILDGSMHEKCVCVSIHTNAVP